MVAKHLVDFYTIDKQNKWELLELEPLIFSKVRKTHLQDTHAEGISQDLVRLIVVTVSDAGRSNEQLKWVVLIQIQRARFYFLLQLSHALLPIAVKYIMQFVKIHTLFLLFFLKSTLAC